MNRLGAVEAFVRVVDADSFCGAARQLRIGRPAVSKTIAQLEERLGVRLLLRSTNGLTPTEAGRNFYDRAKRSIEEGEAAELAARGTAAALSGRLRICAPLTFTCLHVMPRLPVFLAELSGGRAGECQGPRICQLPGPSLAADPTAGRQPDRR